MNVATKSIAFALVVVLLFCSTSTAQDFDWGGYFKSMATSGSTIFSEDYYQVTHRLRLETTWFPTSEFEFRLNIDNQIRWGSLLQTEQFEISKPLEDVRFIDLQLNPLSNEQADWQALIHRAFMRYSGDKVDITIGRQRIAWGTGRIWNPTDLFNPTSPVSLEPGEKQGADAVHLAYRPSFDSMVEVAWSIGADEEDIRWGLRSTKTLGTYDISLMAGKFQQAKVLGLDFSGYLGDAGFRGEFSYTEELDKSYFRSVISGQYTFAGGLDLLVEYLYNGGNLGSIDSLDDLDLESFSRYDSITTFNKQFLGLMVSRRITDLLAGSITSIIDISGGSAFLFPALSYSLLQDLDIMAGGQFFFGDSGDFSYYSPVYVISAEWYF
jgi:hypothetical protein